MKTTLPSSKSLRNLALSAVIAASVGSSLHAAPLVVQNSDVTAGSAYNFTILSGDAGLAQYAEGGSGPGLVDNVNFLYLNEGAPGFDTFLRGQGGATSASLVLGWDFSQSSFRPTQLTLATVTVDFTNPNPITTWTYSYSTDGFDYTTFSTFSGFADVTPKVVPISDLPDSFYVKIEVTGTQGFGFPQIQLGRATEGTPSLTADFAVAAVPEPSTVLLAGLGVAFVLFRLARRSVKSVA